MSKSKLLFTGAEWDVDTLEKVWRAVDVVGRKHGLTYPEPRIEITTDNQMIEAIAAIGLPELYSHWSFGKSFVGQKNSYDKGHSNLPYELIINSDPPIAYLMENNTATLQLLVLAHACCGHADFFHNNYLFQKYTRPKDIIAYCRYVRKRVKAIEQKIGEDRVTFVLDAAHTLQNYAVDHYIRKPESDADLSAQKEALKIANELELASPLDVLKPQKPKFVHRFGSESGLFGNKEENILYFIEKYSPTLCEEERELLAIVRRLATYFYPQSRTKVMNEGWATFWQKIILQEMYDAGQIDDGTYIEFVHHHTNVTRQANCPSHDHDSPQDVPKDERGYYGLNPYALGEAIWLDIKRICEAPTEEDKKFFPELVGKDWVSIMMDIRANYTDQSFVAQFLSPKVVRDFRLFTVERDQDYKARFGYYQMKYAQIGSTHGDEDFYYIRDKLSDHFDMNLRIPRLEICAYHKDGDRSLHIDYFKDKHFHELDQDSLDATQGAIHFLWGFEVCMYDGVTGVELSDIVLEEGYNEDEEDDGS